MVQNPLRLTLLCSTWQSGEGDLPQTKAGLYQQFVQQIYTWKKNRFPISTEERQKLNNVLGRLALKDIQEGGSRFLLLESFITKELGDPDDEKSSFYKALQLGWLNHVGIAAESQSKEKVYAFFHATFEEYFAALAIDDWDFFLPRAHKDKLVKDKNTGKPKPYRIFEPQWKEVILLWLGREDVEREQKEEFIKALVEFHEGCGKFYHYRAYFLAAAGVAEFGDYSKADEVVAQIVNVIDALVKLIATSQDGFTRRESARSLENILTTDQMPKVVTALRYDSKPNEERYKVIWHCAQNMSYPDFYQAWHHRSYMKLAIRFARYRWWQVALCLFLGLSIFALVRFTVSPSVNNPANIQRQQQIR